MWLEQARRVFYDLGPERQLPRDVQLPGFDEKRDVGALRQLRMLFQSSGLDIDQSGMRVLRVVDGILVALRDRQLEVELDRGVRRAQQVEVPHRIRTDPVDQLVQRHKAPRAL